MKKNLSSHDHLVSFPLLTIVTGQGHISKVNVFCKEGAGDGTNAKAKRTKRWGIFLEFSSLF